MTFFIGCQIKTISHEELTPQTAHFLSSDNKSFILKYEDGSVATIDYFAVGHNTYPKEYMEIHFDQKTIVLDDYRSLKGYGIAIDEISSKSSQKGQLEELERLYLTLTSNDAKWPIDLWDMVQTTAASFLLK
jgi:predicted dehydrogenase